LKEPRSGKKVYAGQSGSKIDLGGTSTKVEIKNCRDNFLVERSLDGNGPKNKKPFPFGIGLSTRENFVLKNTLRAAVCRGRETGLLTTQRRGEEWGQSSPSH